jgi:hypothetical protein
VIVEPQDGTRLLVNPTDVETPIPLRASVGAIRTADVVWEVDGRVVQGSAWRAVPGSHQVVAIVAGRRSRAARIEVDVP